MGEQAGAGTTTRREFYPEHLHDGLWWTTYGPCQSQAAAIERAKTIIPSHCNGGVIRVVEVVTTKKVTQVWDAAPQEGDTE